MKCKYDWLTVRILIGLPGSGKTSFIKNTIEEYNSIFDDILSIEDIARFKEDCNEYGGLVVIADCNLCNKENLIILERILKDDIQRESKTEKIYFENNPDACRHNTSLRNDNRNVENSINNLSRFYNPPSNAIKVEKYNDSH